LIKPFILSDDPLFSEIVAKAEGARTGSRARSCGIRVEHIWRWVRSRLTKSYKWPYVWLQTLGTPSLKSTQRECCTLKLDCSFVCFEALLMCLSLLRPHIMNSTENNRASEKQTLMLEDYASID